MLATKFLGRYPRTLRRSFRHPQESRLTGRGAAERSLTLAGCGFAVVWKRRRRGEAENSDGQRRGRVTGLLTLPPDRLGGDTDVKIVPRPSRVHLEPLRQRSTGTPQLPGHFNRGVRVLSSARQQAVEGSLASDDHWRYTSLAKGARSGAARARGSPGVGQTFAKEGL